MPTVLVIPSLWAFTQHITVPRDPVPALGQTGNAPSKPRAGLNESTTGENESITSGDKASTVLDGSASIPNESPTHPSESTTVLSESTTSLNEATTGANKPLSSEEELEEGEILSTPPSTNRAPRAPKPRRPTAPPPQYRRARGLNPSPETSPKQPAPVKNTPHTSQKRKRLSTAGPPAGHSQSHEKKTKKRKKKSNEEKQDYKFCWELGQGFIGFVFDFTGIAAWLIASKILELPVPTQVRNRLVYFCDASIRLLCGAAGIVWPERYPSSNWQGKGVYYPLSIDNSGTVELFAIACTLKTAIEELDKENATIVANIPVDEEFFQESLLWTRSHLHTMTKEVFIFTDDIKALRRIDGDLAYPPNGDIAAQMASISESSKTLNQLEVHLELHLSPGHSKVPGNEAADAMAKRAQNELFRQTAISWPDME